MLPEILQTIALPELVGIMLSMHSYLSPVSPDTLGMKTQ